MYYLLYSFVFYIKAILLSPTKVKVKIKICKKSVYHKIVVFLFRHCKSNIISLNPTKLQRKSSNKFQFIKKPSRSEAVLSFKPSSSQQPEVVGSIDISFAILSIQGKFQIPVKKFEPFQIKKYLLPEFFRDFKVRSIFLHHNISDISVTKPGFFYQELYNIIFSKVLSEPHIHINCNRGIWLFIIPDFYV